ncbi:fructose-6-phosphate aldolase [Lederbergia citrea]|uniref:Fructose-6-phosphate aldolase n=1 Tax=Lederbergia citrea TaxID=2833581 RepID=A0A942UPL4_9BACI|nr:fructose-6-phosphate aldolase [Lederbergia citrea]MBS4221734.1 fructose-6-phosphate aldolase [Lederbergia citrea]
MEIYIDTADLNEIKKAMSLSILDGVTTNPTILSKQGVPYKERLGEINEIVDGKIWYQVVSSNSEAMVREALEVVSLLEQPVIKLPIGQESLKASKILSNQGIETNMTLVFSVAQAILSAKAGASYISPYVGRINDIGWSGLQLIKDITQIFSIQGIQTKVIGASLRSSQDIVSVAELGAKAATMPFKVLTQMLNNPMTDSGLVQFNDDWKAYQRQLATTQN